MKSIVPQTVMLSLPALAVTSASPFALPIWCNVSASNRNPERAWPCQLFG